MKTKDLSKQELVNINGGAAGNSIGFSGTIGADSLLAISSESTNGNDYHKTAFSVGNGISLNLLGLNRNNSE